MSQSISSDRISESTIARMAGNMMDISTDGADIVRYGAHGVPPDSQLVRGTVALARAIAAEVRRTGPMAQSPHGAAHVSDLTPAEAYKLGWHDGKADGPATTADPPPPPDSPLVVPVEVCLGCNRQTHLGDCGCPAGTGTRQVFAITEAEYRAKAKAVRQALLGPDVQDHGHAPTAELAKALRLSFEQSVRRGAAQDAQVADLRSEIKRLDGLLQQRGDEVWVLRRNERDATEREVRTLLRVAEELENGLRSGSVPPDEMIANEINWCRSQARNLQPTVTATLHGGERGGKAERLRLRLRMDLACPTCGSHDPDAHPTVQPDGGEVQVCRDDFHGGKVCPTCASRDRRADRRACRDPWHGMAVRA